MYDYGQRQKGITSTYLHLQQSIKIIEKMVSNPSQRYKLLKYVIERMTKNEEKMDILEGKEPNRFAFCFEKGNLIVDEKPDISKFSSGRQK